MGRSLFVFLGNVLKSELMGIIGLVGDVCQIDGGELTGQETVFKLFVF
jgi:hypothetical protein